MFQWSDNPCQRSPPKRDIVFEGVHLLSHLFITYIEKFEQIVVLTMDVPNNVNRALKLKEVTFFS